MTTKWASMSTAGRLTLNSELLDLPRSTGEYVIVYESVHLLAPSHGKVFKSFMAAFMPDWEEREKGLGYETGHLAQRVRVPLPALSKISCPVALGRGFCYTGFDAESSGGGRENDCTLKRVYGLSIVMTLASAYRRTGFVEVARPNERRAIMRYCVGSATE